MNDDLLPYIEHFDEAEKRIKIFINRENSLPTGERLGSTSRLRPHRPSRRLSRRIQFAR